MSRKLYSYRLGQVVPMLTEDEFEKISVHFKSRIDWIKDYMGKHGCTLSEARERCTAWAEAMKMYEALTGHKLDHEEHLIEVRLSQYGRPCPSCSKPFRTPKAKFCAECGFALPDGEVAGPASI